MDRLEAPLEALLRVSLIIGQLCTTALRDKVSEAPREALSILTGSLCTCAFTEEVRDGIRTIADTEESGDSRLKSLYRSLYRRLYVAVGDLSGELSIASDGPSRILHAQCRICHEEEDAKTLETRLETPGCACRGSMMHAHRQCIQRWCDQKGDTVCEVCRQPYTNGYTAAGRASGRPRLNQGAVYGYRRGYRAVDRARGRLWLNQGAVNGAAGQFTHPAWCIPRARWNDWSM